jgi:hypothetical protein
VALVGVFVKEKKRVKQKKHNPDSEEENEAQSTNTEEKAKLKDQVKRMFKFLIKPVIFLPLFFIFGFNLTPSKYEAVQYFYINELNFSYTFIGGLSAISSGAMMLGILLYNRFFRNTKFKKLIFIATIFQTGFNLCLLILIFGINREIYMPDKAYAILVRAITSLISELQTMAVLILGVRLCPKDIEAFIFETICGLRDLSYSLSFRMGGALTGGLDITASNFQYLWVLCVISSVCPLTLLIFLPFVPIKDSYKEVFKQIQQKPPTAATDDNSQNSQVHSLPQRDSVDLQFRFEEDDATIELI